MRIGLDLQSVRGPVSGIGAYALGLAQALAALAALPKPGGGAGGHTFVPLSYPGFQRWPAPAEIARAHACVAAEAWWKGLDVIHSPGFAPPLWSPAARVLTLHDLSVWERPELLPPGPSRWYWGEWMARAAQRADRIVTPSRFTAERVQACWGVPRERVRHIPYPPRERFRPPGRLRQREMRRHFRLPEPYIFGLGALEPRKDWLAVVRAFALMRHDCSHTLILAGPVNVAASQAELAAEIERLGLGGRVRHLGYVDEAWLPALYAASDAFVFPETYAGYGLPVLEAMACGAAVVTFDNTALTEAAGGAAELIAPPYAPDRIAAALLGLARDPRRRARWIAAGLARAAQLDWPTTARATVEVYERCLDA